jgi:hypothetical protein
MDIGQTGRGFRIGEFKDRYGVKCVIQDSSSSEPAVWLGTKENKLHFMASMSRETILGFVRELQVVADRQTTPQAQLTGWLSVELPMDNAMINDRMLLTPAMAKDVVKYLTAFIKTGSIAGKVDKKTEAKLSTIAPLGDNGTRWDRVYKCAKCGHIYQEKVDECDCLDEGETQSWLEGVALFQ